MKNMEINDLGIIMELLGFFLITLTGGRNPSSSFLLLSGSKESRFNKFREKIIPDNFVTVVFYYGIALVIFGLIFQMTIFYNS